MKCWDDPDADPIGDLKRAGAVDAREYFREKRTWVVGPEAARQVYGRYLCECRARIEFTRTWERVSARCLKCKKEVDL